MHLSKALLVAPLALAAASAFAQTSSQYLPIGAWPGDVATGPVADTSNSSSVTNWRLSPTASFNGVANAFDGTALLLFTATGLSGTYACSGSLVSSEWVLTAAHCVDGLLTMSVQFGYYGGTALQTRTVVSAVQSPGWDGSLDTGADIALVKLNAPVTGLHTYALSTTNDVGKQFLITGYGSTGTGTSTSSATWSDPNYGHYGYNTFDTTSAQFGAAWDAYNGEGIYVPPTYGQTYVADFDAVTLSDTLKAQYNSLQRIADLTGGGWTSDTGVTPSANEALIAGGDSGGGDFVWDGTQWVLSAVHSWGWAFCGGRVTTPSCDYRANNSTSYGDLMGSTAVNAHVDWINATITPVPEPTSYALMALGLLAVGARLRQRRG